MRSSQDQVLTSRLWPVGIAAGYFACAAFALRQTASSGGEAYIWPASGVLLAGLLLSSRANRPVVLTLVACASAAANLLSGLPVWTALGFTAANLVEGVIAARLAIGGNGEVSFQRPRQIIRFAIGVLIAGAVSAAVATAVAGAAEPWSFYISWFVTVTLGMLVVAPAVIVFLRRVLARVPPVSSSPLLTGVSVHAIALLAALLTFAQATYPLLIVPSTMVIFATYFLGFSGAIGSILIAAAVAELFTSAGSGPIAMVGDPRERIVFFQFYVFILFFSAVPLATLLAKSRRDAAELKDTHALLEAAERTAHVGHWRFDLREQTAYWSDESYRIHGIALGEPMSRARILALYHPEDQAKIGEAFEGAITAGASFSYQSRILRPDGTVRQVESRGEAEIADGKPVALFGVVMDVTDRNEAFDALAQARQLAERRAIEATKIAETDQLTGLANRRKVLAFLESAVKQAKREGTDLAVVMLDADYFKIINDSFGHAAGDAVLQQIAKTAACCLQESDMLGRIGGEEFLIVLPGAGEQRAMRVAEKIRSGVASLRLDEVGQREFSVSLGVKVLNAGSDAALLLQAADAALYESKADGRNRVTIAA